MASVTAYTAPVMAHIEAATAHTVTVTAHTAAGTITPPFEPTATAHEKWRSYFFREHLRPIQQGDVKKSNNMHFMHKN